MSVQAITWAYAQTDLSSAEKFVLVTLSNRGDEDWSCYPSIQLISADTSLSEKTVRRALDDLESRGLIARERQRNPDGSLGRYRYFLKPPVSMTTGEKPQQSLGVVTMTGRKKPEQKQHAVTMTSGENVEGNHGAVTVTSGGPSGHPVPNPSGHHDRSTKPSVLSNRQKKENTSEKAQAPLSDLSQAFEAIWANWPERGRQRSKSKPLCFEALKRATGQTPASVIVEAVRKFVSKTEPQFVPALDRWLRDGKFEHFAPSDPQLPFDTSSKLNWKSLLREWVDYGTWPRAAGPTPDQHDYRGPIDALEALLPEFAAGHPVARDIRRTIEIRKRA